MSKILAWLFYQWHLRLWYLNEQLALNIYVNSCGFDEIAVQNPKYKLYRAKAEYHGRYLPDMFRPAKGCSLCQSVIEPGQARS